MHSDGKLRILLVEDERSVRLALKSMLEEAGYEVAVARDGEEGLGLFLESGFDVVLSDVLMPKMNGYELCAKIRERGSSVPVVFLTAKDRDVDVLAGFGYGADDYVSKDVSREILLARLAVQARRVRKSPPEGAFAFGSWAVDALALEIRHFDGRCMKLSEREVFLLRLFADHPNEVLNRDYLQTRIWGIDYRGDATALTMAIYRLKTKLAEDGGAIETVHCVGYRYRPQERRDV